MAAGEYSLDVPIGTYTVKASKSNYNVETSEAEVLECQTTIKNFQLERGGNSMGAHLFNANLECNSISEFSNKTLNNAIAAASNEQAKTGTYSLKVDITLAGGHAKLYPVLIDAPHSELYFRFYYYLPTATYDNIVDNADDRAGLLSGFDSVWGIVISLAIWNVAGTVMLKYNHADATDTVTCPSRDAWHCVELYHKRDAAAGAWEWWIDGVSEGSGTGVNTGANNIYYPLFGVPTSNGMTGVIYEDNMVIATSRIHQLMGNIEGNNTLKRRTDAPQGWVI